MVYYCILMLRLYLISGAEGGTSELDKAPSSPISPSIILSPEQKQRRYERVSSKSQEMMYKFQKLFTATKKSL